jgi:hypothetical protein
MTATATIVFDRDSYGPADDIHFQVQVSVPMTETRTVTGAVKLPDGTSLPAESTTTVHGVYGPFTADGYTVVQDSADPSRFTATPAA